MRAAAAAFPITHTQQCFLQHCSPIEMYDKGLLVQSKMGGRVVLAYGNVI